jgi:hypothetical protein
LLRKELTRHCCSGRTIELLLGENNNRPDHLAHTGSELTQVQIVPCLVDRRNKTLLTSQSSGETTSELLLVMDGPIRLRKVEKILSSCLSPRLPDKRGSTLPHKTQNTKHQYQDWMPKE